MDVSHVDRIPEPHLSPREGDGPKYRLLEVLRNRLRTRHYSRRTEVAYVDWVRRFVIFHGRRHPRTMGTREIAAFLSHLATERKVSASTQNQALAAILFLYRHCLSSHIGFIEGIERARRPVRVPVVLTQAEVRALLRELRGVSRLCALLMYGAGLRVSECVSLRVKDLDFERHEITLRAGKGDKDRRVPLPRTATRPLALHLERERDRLSWDLARGVRNSLPDAIAVKLPTPNGRGPGGSCSADDAWSGTRAVCCGGIICMRPSFSARWRSRRVPPAWPSA